MTPGMRTEHLAMGGEVDFRTAKRAADELASLQLEEAVCLSWHDAVAGRESPAHVSECHTECEIPGSIEYAAARGGELVVIVDQGRFTFCYRSLGEFAGD